MAYQIIAKKCTNCGDCKWDCPTEAISIVGYIHVIDPTKCKECEGFYDKPQCASVCPVPNTCVPLRDAPK